MSLDNIQLPDLVIANLYKDSLVRDQEGAPKQERAPGKEVPVEQAPVKPADPVKPVAATPATTVAAAATAPPAKSRFLGNNQKNISIIVDFRDEPFLPETHLQFLTKMLGACKLNLGDVAIMNIAAAPVEMEELKSRLQPKYVLLFGVNPEAIKLPFEFPFFKEQQYAGCTYLSIPPFDELNTETHEGKLLKSKLWVCLQKLFSV